MSNLEWAPGPGGTAFSGATWGIPKKRRSDAFQVCLDTQICFFRYGEVYGQGRSERLLGEFIAESGANVLVATKFMPFPAFDARTLLHALRKPGAVGSFGSTCTNAPAAAARAHETWMERWGSTTRLSAIGVSNYDETKPRAYDALNGWVPFVRKPVEYSLLQRRIEGRIVRLCRQLEFGSLRMSPGDGCLTGKIYRQQPAGGSRSRRYSRQASRAGRTALSELRKIGSDRGKTPRKLRQLGLCKGALPIPGAQESRQAEENAGALAGADRCGDRPIRRTQRPGNCRQLILPCNFL